MELDVRAPTGEEWAAMLRSQPVRPLPDWKASARKVHHSQLGPAVRGTLRADEWETFRERVGQMLADGRAGQFVLIDGTDVVGYFPTFADALLAAQKTRLGSQAFIHEVEEWIPFLTSGYSKLCQ